MKSLFLDAAAKTDYLDSLIGATIVLLILSLITQKFVEFIRKYISVPPKYNKLNLYRNINAKTIYGFNQNNEELKSKKRKEISALAILVGIFIALFAKASLFDLLSSNPQDRLFWPEGFEIEYKTWFDILKFIFGILFTGFFLSFGSKFFHDLLDILYQTKEYKRKLLSKETYEQDSASNVSDFIEANSYDLAKKALAKHGKSLKEKYSNLITSLEIGNTVNSQVGIIANLKQKPPSDFPKSLSVKLKSGKIIGVEVEAIIDEIAKAHYGIGYNLQNPDEFGKVGTLGSILLSSEDFDSKFILTCSHVVLGGSSENLNGYSDNGSFDINIEILDFNNKIAEGELIYAKLDNKSDTAIIKLNDYSIDLNNELPDGNTFNAAISVFNLINNNVYFYSTTKQEIIEGVIHKRLSKKEILLEYGDSSVKSFFELIVVGNNQGEGWSTISESGNSGSILYDENYRPFGLIIGGSNQFTYAIPLLQILNDTNTEIYQS
jgi:hypothetical protein